MNQNELKDYEYQCGSKTIKCEYCGENVTKITYDLHLEYTCEKFKKNNNKDNNNNIDEDNNKIINKNKKEKNMNKKNGNKKNAKKRKRSDNKDNDEDDFKPQKKNIINFINYIIF